jgi:hypothetical protein
VPRSETASKIGPTQWPHSRVRIGGMTPADEVVGTHRFRARRIGRRRASSIAATFDRQRSWVVGPQQSPAVLRARGGTRAPFRNQTPLEAHDANWHCNLHRPIGTHCWQFHGCVGGVWQWPRSTVDAASQRPYQRG